ncbi:hypothetical protein M011DRAFT_165288 [Sporormia fimetaria CBS 119925]|uniref:F-box domain-containing protein n=1 Tax=Sporormia fimetaria CBS 119925 TaxID=1340428 RepID=A0A6A6V5D6_9PLEO|nr:hypothetical protein M011DRAFT_165288 [Sporormia fimetaria CBS 119925]
MLSQYSSNSPARVSSIFLADLPEELLLEILTHIELDDVRTYSALHRVNRRLYRLTMKPLYRSFPGRKPELFLRALALSSHLGAPDLPFVEHVTWRQWARVTGALKYCRPTQERRLLADKLLQLEKKGVISRAAPLVERFLSFDRPDEDTWYLELFLLLTPHVKSLEVFDSWYWDDHKYWFRTLCSNPVRMSNL